VPRAGTFYCVYTTVFQHITSYPVTTQ